ncbi:DUF6279 family lipoprotein [Vibrio sp. 10N.261.51.F12]|uniref:DUF6279 family lipoprotein n=1 Tax=Vibrio sp. 10N.261.51.F12 TaxID=3229679 RepID=UPI00354F1D5C
MNNTMLRNSVAAVFALVTLVGCGTKFLYSNLDWIIVEYIDDYVTLTGGQEEILSERIEVLSDWHRQEELPSYLRQLDTIRQQDPNQASQAFVLEQMREVRQHSQRLVERMTPDLYALTQQLNDQQVNELVKNLAKQDKKLLEKYQGLDGASIRQMYQERIESSFERWYGEVTPEHHLLAIEWSESMEITAVDWQMHRENMQRYIKQLLLRRNDLAYFQPEFQRFMNSPDSYYSEALTAKVLSNRQTAAKYIAKSLNTLTEKQKKHLISEIDDWRDIAKDLMALKTLDYSPTAFILRTSYTESV